jgi:hypothetical protein
MSWRAIAFALSLLTILTLSHRDAAGGPVTTALQTESIPMTPTNWGAGTGGITDPFDFTGFNSSLGTLSGVEITLSLTIRNDYIMVFPATPTPTTLYLATTQTSDPSILANPSLVQQLTDGPSETLLAPDRVAAIFSGAGTRLPVDVVSLTEPAGTWSSFLPVTSPNYIAPSMATISLSITINNSNLASLLSEFIGSGTIDLPITANANSSFYSSSGNGSGTVLTSASTTITLDYQYTPAAPQTTSTPEPSGLTLLGLGAGVGLLAAARVRRAARPVERDRD